MPRTSTTPRPGAVRRAAALARGPHACPWCESPTFAEPPVPWPDERDYLVRCDSCDRPIQVQIDVDRVARRVTIAPSSTLPPHDSVESLLSQRGLRGLGRRCAVAASLPFAVGCLALAAGLAPLAIAAAMLVAVVPAAMWWPAVVAIGKDELVAVARPVHARAERPPICLSRGRFDQWLREERRRERERADDPEALLAELERVLDQRELRRVRMLAEQGEVPAAHLDDLLHYRRSWRTVA